MTEKHKPKRAAMPIDWPRRGQQDAEAKRPPEPPWPPLNGSDWARERHHIAFCGYMEAYNAVLQSTGSQS